MAPSWPAVHKEGPDVTLAFTRRRWRAAGAFVILLLRAGAGLVALSRRAAPVLPTAEVTRGDFVDIVELRGEIRPVRSVVLTAPTQAGDLRILRLAKNGTTVKPGDVVVEFDPTMLTRQRQERMSELRQADAEIEQATGEARILAEQNRTTLMRARYDVDRAGLDMVERDFLARLTIERAKLALDDARQRLAAVEEKVRANEAASAATIAARQRRRAKVQQDLDRTEQSLGALRLRAPSAGIVSLMTNYSSSGMMGGAPQEFREGDSAWSGGSIVELPDLSSVLLTARLEESDRSRVDVGQPAVVRADAVPDREYAGKVAAISILARVDFTAGWPPSRDFDVKLAMADADVKLRPGMSAVVRISVGRLAGVLLAPVEALSLVNGRPTVYRLAGAAYVEQAVEVVRRGKEQVVIGKGVAPGDRLALKKPPATAIRGGQ
jgi:multidrug efflux pump subunit AcrA (membrane-fusion protein)